MSQPPNDNPLPMDSVLQDEQEHFGQYSPTSPHSGYAAASGRLTSFPAVSSGGPDIMYHSSPPLNHFSFFSHTLEPPPQGSDFSFPTATPLDIARERLVPISLHFTSPQIYSPPGQSTTCLLCFCTLLRLQSGITLNNGRIVNPTILARYLTWLPGHDSSSVKKLLYPDDPQDVPRAVELMQAIVDLGKLELPVTADIDVNVISDMDAIRLLGAMLEAILEPFANVEFSLTDQLYGDSQMMVKNAMFCIAKQQRLDSCDPFYLFDIGDDSLERLFGRIRMLGAHDAGINFRQGIDRLGHAVDIDTVFLRHPELDPGHRRIKMDRVEGVDHLNAAAWKGDVISGHCDLPSAWAAGRDAAVQVLMKSQLPPGSYDYFNILATPGVDFLRPFGQDKYPGIEGDHDRSMDTDLIGVDAAEDSGNPLQENSCDSATQLCPPEGVIESNATGHSTVPENDNSADSDSPTICGDGLTSDSDTPDLLTLEEALGEAPELALPSGPGIDPSDYVFYNGAWIHKQSLCRILINRNFVQKSRNRPERVRGFTKVNHRHANLNADAILDPDAFIVGDPLLTIVRTERILSLALMRSTSINENGVERETVKLATLSSTTGNIKISGQLTVLVPAKPLPSSMPLPTTAGAVPSVTGLLSWIWTGGYVKTDSAMRGTSEHTEKPVVITVPGYLTEFVNPDIVDAESRLGVDQAHEINSVGKSWEIYDAALRIATQSLWQKITSTKTALTSLASVNKSASFPYSAEGSGMSGLTCEEGTQQLAIDHGKHIARTCHFCGQAPDNWRAHIGMHILRTSRSVTENNPLHEQVGKFMPCGFCGRSNQADCAIHLKITARAVKIECNCKFNIPFKYGPANKGSDTTPCRNVPIICTLCPESSNKSIPRPAVWRYNMVTHLQSVHPEYASPRQSGGLPLPFALWKELEISPKEEKALGIPDSLIPASFTAVEEPRPEPNVASTNGRAKRKAGTTSQAASRAPKRARHTNENVPPTHTAG
ncbi:hypothetical protein B0H21DRAFT_883457 [Amylocystis lapponica]|nr:hypothetical protein B0H21DRAFT_883457 [Amylocystis lapponica]